MQQGMRISAIDARSAAMTLRGRAMRNRAEAMDSRSGTMSVRTTRVRTASPAATKEHAKLLACVDLLRDAECSSHVAGI
jgi:hypothetical protein